MQFLNSDGTTNDMMERSMHPTLEDMGSEEAWGQAQSVAEQVRAFLLLHGMSNLFTIVDTCAMDCNYDGYLAMSEKLVEHERKGFALTDGTLWVVIYHLDPDYCVVQFQWDDPLCAGEPSYMSPLQVDCLAIKRSYSV